MASVFEEDWLTDDMDSYMVEPATTASTVTLLEAWDLRTASFLEDPKDW